MARIDLGIDRKTGQPAWADILDVEDMTGRTRRMVRDKAPVGVGADGTTQMSVTGGTGDLLHAELLAQVITEWSFGTPITAENVEDLPLRMLEKLEEATEEHWKLVNFSKKTGGANTSE